MSSFRICRGDDTEIVYLFFTTKVPPKTSHKEFLWCRIVRTQCTPKHQFVIIFFNKSPETQHVFKIYHMQRDVWQFVLLILLLGYSECHIMRVFYTVRYNCAQRMFKHKFIFLCCAIIGSKSHYVSFLVDVILHWYSMFWNLVFYFN